MIDQLSFAGIAPLQQPHLLPDTAGQIAINCLFRDGAMTPARMPQTVSGVTLSGSEKSIYRFGQDADSALPLYWFLFNADTSVVKSNAIGNSEERTYFASSGSPPRKTNFSTAVVGSPYPNVSYRLSVPDPQAPTLASKSAGTGTAEQRAYVYTVETDWYERSRPSAAVLVDTQSDGIVVINTPGLTSGELTDRNFGAGATKTLWRSVNGNYLKVATVPYASTQITDTASATSLVTVLDSADYDLPPDDMHSLIALPNSFYAAASGNDLCLSEVGIAHAWPIKYRKAADFKIVGLGAIGSNVVVMTKAFPYYAYGSAPKSMEMSKVDLNQSCLSRRSIAAGDAVVLYAGPDGLVGVSGPSAAVLTERFIGASDWRKLNPASMLGVWWNGAYYGFFDTGTAVGNPSWIPGQRGCFVYDPTDPWAPISFLDIHATAAWVDPRDNTLYLASGTTLQTLSKTSGSNATMKWRSRRHLYLNPVNPKAAKIDADGAVTFRLYGDGVLRYTKTVTDSKWFKLPRGYKAESIVYEVESSSIIRRVHVATILP